jgi:predicted Zn-dependent peptidase
MVILPDPEATTIAVEVFFTVGLADERRYPGINALIARTWGGESENRYAPLLKADIARIGSLGTDFSEDWVELWGICASSPTEFRKLLQTLLTNVVANPRFSEEAIQKAKEEQQQTLLLQRDHLVGNTIDRLRGRIFGNSPFGRPLYGSEEGLQNLTALVVENYYKQLFRPDRCIIVVAGAVKTQETQSLIEASLGAGGWNSAPSQRPEPLESVEAIPPGLRDMVLARTAPAGVLTVGFLAPGTELGGGRENYARLLLLDAVISGGKSGRLFRHLRDGITGQEPIGYDVRTQIQPGRAQSLWIFYATGVRSLPDCREALLNELKRVANGTAPISAKELERAKALLQAKHQLRRQRLKERAFATGWSEVMGLGADFDVALPTLLNSITEEDLNRFAGKLLSASPAIVYIPGY